MLLPRRGLGWLVIVISVALLWLSACGGAARPLSQLLLPPPAALSFDRVRELRADVIAKKPVAIVVLGGGRRAVRPRVRREQPAVTARSSACAMASGSPARRVRRSPSAAAPAGGSGSTAEARVAAKIAADEFGRPIRWIEDESHDTRENAARTIDAAQVGGDQPRRPRHPRLSHAARAARVPRSSGCRFDADRGRADGACPTASRHPGLEWLPSARRIPRRSPAAARTRRAGHAGA